jgi:hypothetical protein
MWSCISCSWSLSKNMTVIKLCWVFSRVNSRLKTNVSETSSVMITLILMMETELVSETLVFIVELTLPNARESFTTLIRRESFKSHKEYDSISRSQLFRIMTKLRIPTKLVNLTKTIMSNSMGRVIIQGILS